MASEFRWDAHGTEPEAHDRLYQLLARKIIDRVIHGEYAVGRRLPAERDLSIEYSVSRSTVREAIIALEVQGLVEVRMGSGAYVRKMPGTADEPGFHVTAFELIEARLAVEGEIAALAAAQITDQELALLDQLVVDIERENLRENGQEEADREFHLLIARATRNAALINAAVQLWQLRASSPDIVSLLAKARAAKVKPVVEEHRAIAFALRDRDSKRARDAMRAHLTAVLDHLLFATEEAAIQEAREVAQSARRRFSLVRAS